MLGSFEDHEGVDGVMPGVPGDQFRLEFTRHRGHLVGRAPTEDPDGYRVVLHNAAWTP